MPRSPRPAVLAAAALALGFGAIVAVPAPAFADPTPLIDETFDGTSVADPAWIPLNDACLTSATGAAPGGASALAECTERVGAPVTGAGDGFLQLTDAQGNQSGGVLYNEPIPGTSGLIVEFDQWQYGGNGADGIGFFLVDGSVNLTSAGGLGGSLGYGNRFDEPGVDGGYLGIGLDVYGNYAKPFEGKDTDCSPAQTGPGFAPNAVSIRGPEGADQLSGYCWLTGTIDLDSPDPENMASTLPGSLRGAGSTDADARTVRVTVSPEALPTVTVAIDFHDGAGFQSLLSYTMETPAPATYKLGFSSSTGGLNDVHLIRNVSVTSAISLGELSIVKQLDPGVDQPAAYAEGDTISYQFVVTNTSDAVPLTGVTVVDPGATGISCPSDELGVAGSATDSMVCTGTHLVTAEEAGSATFTNTAHAEAMDGEDAITSDDSSLTVDIAAPAPALELSKTSSAATTVERGQTVTYTITAENTGNVTLDDVAIADDLSDVLDDAALSGTPTGTLTPGGATTVTTGATSIGWTGSLAPGQSVQIQYAVAVNGAAADGATLGNSVTASATGVDELSAATASTVDVPAPPAGGGSAPGGGQLVTSGSDDLPLRLGAVALAAGVFLLLAARMRRRAAR